MTEPQHRNSPGGSESSSNPTSDAGGQVIRVADLTNTVRSLVDDALAQRGPRAPPDNAALAGEPICVLLTISR